jgi:hypothetical protein
MKHQQAAGHQTQHKPAPKSAARASAKSSKSPVADGADGDGDGRYEMIRETAYGFYVARGCVAGHELEDWLQAEAVVNGTHSNSSQTSQTSESSQVASQPA